MLTKRGSWSDSVGIRWQAVVTCSGFRRTLGPQTSLAGPSMVRHMMIRTTTLYTDAAAMSLRNVLYMQIYLWGEKTRHIV